MNEATYVKGFHHDDKVKKMAYGPFGKTGIRVSRMAFGGTPAGNLFGTLDEERAIELTINAVKSGVNLIDTAPFYGNRRSEALIGKALRRMPRQAFYISTKVGRYEPNHKNMFDFSKEKVLKEFEKSLELLGVDYVDLLCVHDLEFAEDLNQVINETLPALQTLKDAGKIKLIGVTGYPLRLLKEVVSKSKVKVDAVLSYSRNTLNNDDLKDYIPFFKERGMGIISAAAVSQGLLTPQGPLSWHSSSDEIKEAAKKANQYCKDNGCNIARIAIYYSLATEGVHTHLMGCNSKEIFDLNYDLLTQNPTQQDIQMAKVLREKFFLPVKVKHWEDKDPETHWTMLKMIRGDIPWDDSVKPFDFD